MIRFVFSAVRGIRPFVKTLNNGARIISMELKHFSTHHNKVSYNTTPNYNLGNSLIRNKRILDISNNITPVPVRTVTKFSLKKGKRKTVKPAICRFFRLHWGIWIRPMVGRHKRLWKKSYKNRRRLRHHVFTNATQSTLLDKMVTKFWKKPKYYVDDPYAPYHTREEFRNTRTKPAIK